jgi:dienelactone hydrolase
MRSRVLTALLRTVMIGAPLAAAACDSSKPPLHPAANQAATTASTPRPQELTYAAVAGKVLGITLRRPDRPRGMVVLVHGGGFRGGARSDMNGWASMLTADGYATATIDYRLDDRRHPTRESGLTRAAHDTIAALTRLQADPALRTLSVVLWGYSAGGRTVLRVSAELPHRVHAAVSLAGYGEPERIKPGNPPMLLFNGTADTVEPPALANATCRAARAARVRCDQVVYPGATHAITARRAREIHRRARAWLAGVLTETP